MAALLTTSHGVYVWNIKELVPRKKLLSAGSEAISCSALSPNGTDIAVCDDAGITIYSLSNNTEKKLKGLKNVRNLTFSHDSKILYFSTQKSKDFVVEAYNVAENRLVGSLNVHRSEIVSLSISSNSTYILSTSTSPPQVHLHNTSHSITSSLAISQPLKHTSYHPTRTLFLGINLTGDLTCYSITSKRPGQTFAIKAITAIWWDSKAIAACEDLSIKVLDFEAKKVCDELPVSAPVTTLSLAEGKLFVGMKTGKCEVWSIGPRGNKMLYNTTVGTEVPILDINWTSIAHTTKAPRKPTVDIPQSLLRSSGNSGSDVLDVFSPLKRKGSNSDTTGERKEKRLKESTKHPDNPLPKKPFSSVEDIDGKVTQQAGSRSTRRDNMIRSKEREMEQEAIKALSRATHPLQISTKDNIPKSPRKSILKDTAYGKETTGTAHETISARLQASPSRRRDVVDEMDDMLPPMSEKESPIPLFRRKSPGRGRSFTTNYDAVGTINVGSPLRSVSVLPTSQSPPKKRKEEEVQKDDMDIWTTTLDPKTTISASSPKNKGPEFESVEPRNRSQILDAAKPPSTSELSPDLASAVLEIQTVLRRDVERLRLDMVRQFISFRSEMGQKWEGEVNRLRLENESLKEELDTLKKENDKKKDSMGRWKIC